MSSDDWLCDELLSWLMLLPVVVRVELAARVSEPLTSVPPSTPARVLLFWLAAVEPSV